MLLSGNVSIHSATAFTLGPERRSSLFISLSCCVLLPTFVTSVMTSLESVVDQVYYWEQFINRKEPEQGAF